MARFFLDRVLKKSQILLSSYNKPTPLKKNLFLKTNRVNILLTKIFILPKGHRSERISVETHSKFLY
ncbi:hypothetical protein LEP1GSC151_5815 [Leptospira interrogans serovar Grippotyphosa str. LT2186]|uniref:Uncharacterized protein n=1 Tax=Leptospira interrogans serovar Grippotyphosa str. LT2186 TaxID=1001599 RepID=M3G019_LEPIR|nr:hypothetical protein LEP1GSC151_5815 [Leptospira interrogans serovar Grippotyphosa str. LT2186]